LPVDEGVLGVDVEYPGAKLVNVRDRVNELAEQMAGIPFQAEIGAFRFVEQALPHGRLGEHVEAHDGQVNGPMGQCSKAMRMPRSAANRASGSRIPAGAAEIVQKVCKPGFRPWDSFSSSMTAPGNPATVFTPMCVATSMARRNAARAKSLCRGVERVFIKRADGRNAQVAGPGLAGELFGEGSPVFVLRSGGTGFKAVPFDGAEAVLGGPIPGAPHSHPS